MAVPPDSTVCVLALSVVLLATPKTSCVLSEVKVALTARPPKKMFCWESLPNMLMAVPPEKMSCPPFDIVVETARAPE